MTTANINVKLFGNHNSTVSLYLTEMHLFGLFNHKLTSPIIITPMQLGYLYAERNLDMMHDNIGCKNEQGNLARLI